MSLPFRGAVLILFCSTLGLAATPTNKAPSGSIVIAHSAPFERISGTVVALQPERYEVDVSTAEGATEPVTATNHMFFFRGGHAVRWTQLNRGDSVVILRADHAAEVAYGTPGTDHADGTVEWVDRKMGTFRLKRRDGFSEDFISGNATHLSRAGSPVRFEDLAPGDVVTVDYEDAAKG